MTESAQALAAFNDYLAQTPPRSLERLAESYRSRTESVPTRQSSTLRKWSGKYHWQDRCREHDLAIAEESAERNKVERLADMEKRRTERLQVARAVRGKAVEALQQYKTGEIRPYAMVQMLAHADSAERLDMGEATSRSELTGKDGGPIEVRSILATLETLWDRPLPPRSEIAPATSPNSSSV